MEIIASEAVSPPTNSKVSDKKKVQSEATKVSTRQTSQEATLVSNMKIDELPPADLNRQI